jgi:hypothetical protein
MQAAETIDNSPDPQRPGKLLQTKMRRPVADANIKQMSGGSWKAHLSSGGVSRHKLGSQNNAGAATTQGKK